MQLDIPLDLIFKRLGGSNIHVHHLKRYYQGGTAVAAIAILLILSMLNIFQGSGRNTATGEGSMAPDLTAYKEPVFELRPPTPEAGLPMDVSRTCKETKVIYNKVEKCGSRTFLYIVQKLALRNKFNHGSSRLWAHKYTGAEAQKAFLTEVNSLELPLLYDRSIHYVHFPRYGAQRPSWISLIRDPLQRFMSQFYYKRYGDKRTRPDTFTNITDSIAKQTFDKCVLNNHKECNKKNAMQVIPYFCGQGAGCRIPNRWALETAQRNVIDNFDVVGILEDLNSTLFVLENVLPQFFKGSRDAHLSLIYAGVIQDYSSQTDDTPSTEAMEEMKKRLALEYEFYDFVKQRLMFMKKQFSALESMPSQASIADVHDNKTEVADELGVDAEMNQDIEGQNQATDEETTENVLVIDNTDS